MHKRLKNLFKIALVAILVVQAAQIHSFVLRALASRYTTRLTGLIGGGTGFQVQMFDGKRYIVTNSHVCQINMQFGINTLFADNDQDIHRILYQSQTEDICLLEPTHKIGGFILGFDPSLGQEVGILGYPELMPLHLSRGEVMAQINMDPGPGGYQHDSFYVSNQVLPGNSGSPVVDFTGRVVGILWGGRNDIFWGLIAPVSDIRKVIARYEGKASEFKKRLSKVQRNLR